MSEFTVSFDPDCDCAECRMSIRLCEITDKIGRGVRMRHDEMMEGKLCCK